jgi:hypothetical protein
VEQKITQAVLGIIVAMMMWNFKTLNDLQLQMVSVKNLHASMADINDLNIKIKELEWKLMRDSMEK